MVTTNSLNSDLNFKANALQNSELPEDKEVARLAGATLNDLVKALQPVLVYVDVVVGQIRGIIVAEEGSESLILGRDGKWYEFKKGSDEAVFGQMSWTYFEFSKIIEGMKKAFEEATNKKREHLAAVEARSSLLGKLNDMIPK